MLKATSTSEDNTGPVSYTAVDMLFISNPIKVQFFTLIILERDVKRLDKLTAFVVSATAK